MRAVLSNFHPRPRPNRLLLRAAAPKPREFWVVRGGPDWPRIMPILQSAIEKATGAGGTHGHEYIRRVEGALAKITRENLEEHFEAANIFNSLRRAQWNWAEAAVKTLREHPDDEVAIHFRALETYHLNARDSSWVTRGKLDRQKLRRGVEEACTLIVGRDGVLITRTGLRDTRLVYGASTLGDRLFDFLRTMQGEWRDYLPWWSEPMTSALTQCHASPLRTDSELSHADIAREVLSRVRPLAFLTTAAVKEANALKRADRAVTQLTVPQTTDAFIWWRKNCPKDLLEFDPYIAPPGYAVARFALQHGDARVAEHFADLEYYHFPRIRPRLFFLGTPDTAPHFYRHLNEALDGMGLLDDPFAVTRTAQYRTMAGKPLRHGAAFHHAALAINGHVEWREMVKGALSHHDEKDIREWVREQGDAIFTDAQGADAEKRQKVLTLIERQLKLAVKPKSEKAVKRYVDAVCVAMQNGLATLVNDHFHADYEGRPTDLICRVFRNHPNPKIAHAFRFLAPHHFAWRTVPDLLGETGEPNWTNVHAIMQEALTLYWAEHTGKDADTAIPAEVIAWVRAVQPPLRRARLKNTALRYQGILSRHFFDVFAHAGYSTEDLITRSLVAWEALPKAPKAVVITRARFQTKVAVAPPPDLESPVDLAAQRFAHWQWASHKFKTPADQLTALLIWTERYSFAEVARLTGRPFEEIESVLRAGGKGPS